MSEVERLHIRVRELEGKLNDLYRPTWEITRGLNYPSNRHEWELFMQLEEKMAGWFEEYKCEILRAQGRL